jgi:signal transduction histidine kinase
MPIDDTALEHLFPLHFVLDGEVRVVQVAARLAALVPALQPGVAFAEVFELQRPRIAPRFPELGELGAIAVVIRARTSGLTLRGQLTATGSGTWLFAGSPVVLDIAELAPLGLKLTDFPPHDARLDLLVLVAAKNAALRDAHQLATRLRELHEREASRARALAGEVVQQERVASVGRTVASVAHEVSTPLGVAYTAGSLAVEAVHDLANVLRSTSLPPSAGRLLDDARDSLSILQANLRRSSELLRQFKGVAVDQAGGGVRSIELGAYVEEVVGNLRPMLRGTAIAVRVEVATPVHCTTQPGVLSQIVTNLVTNAVLHAFAPGQAGHITLHVGRDGDLAGLDISDDGAGMSPEVAARAFEPFYTTRGGSGGSGLGLFIVHHAVVEALGGTVALDTAPGAGCRFRIRFPVVSAA